LTVEDFVFEDADGVGIANGSLIFMRSCVSDEMILFEGDEKESYFQETFAIFSRPRGDNL
jgi:hypothetical protein